MKIIVFLSITWLFGCMYFNFLYFNFKSFMAQTIVVVKNVENCLLDSTELF